MPETPQLWDRNKILLVSLPNKLNYVLLYIHCFQEIYWNLLWSLMELIIEPYRELLKMERHLGIMNQFSLSYKLHEISTLAALTQTLIGIWTPIIGGWNQHQNWPEFRTFISHPER
jgi:hypothetical protein